MSLEVENFECWCHFHFLGRGLCVVRDHELSKFLSPKLGRHDHGFLWNNLEVLFGKKTSSLWLD